MEDLVATVQESLAAETREEFERRVAEQAKAMVADVEAGRLDNPDFATGMELEAYVVDEDGRLCAVPDGVHDVEGCDKELGVHNLEIHTPPDVFDADGIDRQATTIRDRVETVRRALGEADCRLALDGMWSVPPANGSRAYLGSATEHDGVVVAENMQPSARYVALDNEILARSGGSLPLSVPGFDGEFPSILLESLTTSIQPHLQVPDAPAFPAYFNAALRTTGPILALTSNSPFLPYDLYGPESGPDDAPSGPHDPFELVEATHHELRIPVFEQSINAGLDAGDEKVRFPRDLETTADVVDRLVADRTYAPFLADEDREVDSYGERYPELAHKRGTYWRWVRAVVGGQSPRGSEDAEEAGASIRIEYRPLPTQPTATDVVACQALVCGLIRGLVAADHPIDELPWTAARDAFYSVVEEGLDGDLAWVTADGERTSDSDVIFDEIFEYARRGLATSGVSRTRIDELLGPIETRWEARMAPSDWKKARVLDELAAGKSFGEAITSMQEQYHQQSLDRDSFAEWL